MWTIGYVFNITIATAHGVLAPCSLLVKIMSRAGEIAWESELGPQNPCKNC